MILQCPISLLSPEILLVASEVPSTHQHPQPRARAAQLPHPWALLEVLSLSFSPGPRPPPFLLISAQVPLTLQVWFPSPTLTPTPPHTCSSCLSLSLFLAPCESLVSLLSSPGPAQQLVTPSLSVKGRAFQESFRREPHTGLGDRKGRWGRGA